MGWRWLSTKQADSGVHLQIVIPFDQQATSEVCRVADEINCWVLTWQEICVKVEAQLQKLYVLNQTK